MVKSDDVVEMKVTNLSERVLRVDRIQDSTRVLGPGRRVAVWFHGCRRGCPGCIAAGMNASSDFTAYAAGDLVDRVIGGTDVEGLTISGGEPFDQDATALRVFLAGVRAAGLSVMAYTGYLLEELAADEHKRPLLENLDILVDGPYREAEDHGEKWRGSANQRIHFLTDRYSYLKRRVEQEKNRQVEITFEEGMQFVFSGIPPRGFRRILEAALARRGLVVEW